MRDARRRSARVGERSFAPDAVTAYGQPVRWAATPGGERSQVGTTAQGGRDDRGIA